jgi:hypothetical protein
MLSDAQIVDSQPVPPVMSLSLLEPLPVRMLLLEESYPKELPETVNKVVPELGTFESDIYRIVLIDGAS